MTENKVLKPQRFFRDTSPQYRQKRMRGYRAMAKDCVRYLAESVVGKTAKLEPFSPHDINPCFFGMNVAPSPDSDGDAIQVAVLRDAGVSAVRIDYPTAEDRAPAQRLIEVLLREGFPLTLHIVQDPDEASAMDQAVTQRRWRDFLDETLNFYGSRIECLEVGSTPNRHSWSGYTSIDYAISASIAREALHVWSILNPGNSHPLLLGPNISDFAPYFTIGQLAECRRRGVCFDAMTDNLFIDRSGEPERFDPHIASRILSGLTRMDLLRKQKILASISSRFGSPRCWCTYTHYTLNFGQVRARYVSEEQYANYMVRSHILSAAAGYFERYYWGTLVSYYKGLIDETVRVRPYPPDVHHRFVTAGESPLWRRRESFIKAYAAMSSQLKGARFVRRLPAPSYVRIFEFQNNDGPLFIGWTRDGRSFDMGRHFIGGKGAPRVIISKYGESEQALESRLNLTESPLYWSY